MQWLSRPQRAAVGPVHSTLPCMVRSHQKKKKKKATCWRYLIAVANLCGAESRSCEAVNDDACDLLSTVYFRINPFQTKYLFVTGCRGDTGSYRLDVTMSISNSSAWCLLIQDGGTNRIQHVTLWLLTRMVFLFMVIRHGQHSMMCVTSSWWVISITCTTARIFRGLSRLQPVELNHLLTLVFIVRCSFFHKGWQNLFFSSWLLLGLLYCARR